MCVLCLAAAIFLSASSVAHACGGAPVCTVIDPTGTPLNVRSGPNGKILGTLKKGELVEFNEHKQVKGKKWALVSKFSEASGYVFGDYLKCKGRDGIGKICTVADPTGTPLNVRESPDGDIYGTWQNGIRVRPFEEVTVKGKKWYGVERLAEDNAIGWVFDPYLKCEEDDG
jgi:uncharacterized protein YgiM (DUF1202 family)